MIKRSWAVFASILIISSHVALAGLPLPRVAQQQVRPQMRVLLIPLDDRPPCLQFTQLVGQVGDVEVVAPPGELLGRFTEPGKPEEIAAWIRAQDLNSFDAAIISLDMVAYGGLVNSRVHRTPLRDALRGVEMVRQMKARAPRLPIFGFNVIMRLAPTGDGRNEAYREKLARWAEISPDAQQNRKLSKEVAQLEREIPTEALADYKQARERNFAVNRASLELVRSGVFNFLILSQDDAKPRGVHIADRERLISEAKAAGLSDRVAVQPGADEVSMLLLARAVNKRSGYSPRIVPIFSSAAIRDGVAPYEDRPLHQTVSFHIAATGSRETDDPRNADVLFFVYGSRFEEGGAERFAKRIAASVRDGRRVIVADIDVKGDVQGADPRFTEALLRHKVFPNLAGYASWNTAGNTIGTALPHGIVYTQASTQMGRYSAKRRERIERAQAKFLLHRLIDDYAYHSLVRPDAIKFAREKRLNSGRLTTEGQLLVEKFINDQMHARVQNLWASFNRGPLFNTTSYGSSSKWRTVTLSAYRLELPWGRTFEAEIDFEIEFRNRR